MDTNVIKGGGITLMHLLLIGVQLSLVSVIFM